MDFDTHSHKKRNIVIVLVVLGMLLLAVGGIVAYQKRAGGAGEASAELEKWCALRQAWQKEATAAAGDVVLKLVQEPDAAKEMIAKRSQIAQSYMKKLATMSVSDPAIQQVELALIKEGKARANTVVEIGNRGRQAESDVIDVVRKAKDELEGLIKERIAQGRSAADGEVAAALAKIADCSGIYRGPGTDAGTADDPFTTWDELDVLRTIALKRLSERIIVLEPQEQYRNQIYHTLLAHYRPTLKRCYSTSKKKNSAMSDELGLRVRVRKNGTVQSLGIEWMEPREDSILECLLTAAAKWHLPRPSKGGEFVVVKLDFAAI